MNHTALDINFYIVFAFLKSEEKKDFVWMLEMLKTLYKHLEFSNSNIIVIDRDLALMNVIEKMFASIVVLLCIWHINMNVLKHCKSVFNTEENWKTFYKIWREIVQTSNENNYQIIWKAFKLTYKHDLWDPQGLFERALRSQGRGC